MFCDFICVLSWIHTFLSCYLNIIVNLLRCKCVNHLSLCIENIQSERQVIRDGITRANFNAPINIKRVMWKWYHSHRNTSQNITAYQLRNGLRLPLTRSMIDSSSFSSSSLLPSLSSSSFLVSCTQHGKLNVGPMKIAQSLVLCDNRHYNAHTIRCVFIFMQP